MYLPCIAPVAEGAIHKRLDCCADSRERRVLSGFRLPQDVGEKDYANRSLWIGIPGNGDFRVSR